MLSRRRIVIAAGAVAALLGGLGSVAAAASSPSQTKPIPAADTPYTRYMHFNDPARQAERQHANRDAAGQRRYEEVWDRVEASRDELYARLAADPRARQAQAAWRTCMRDAGYDYQDPTAVETAMHRLAPGTAPDGASDASDACEVSTTKDVERALIEEYESSWVKANADLLDAADRAARGR